jgi:ADP-heptose:LPS heptosyltransferase
MKEVVVFIRSMQFLGTQIVSYPLLYQIKQFWPDCHLRVVAQDNVGKHYLSLPWVDEFVQADRFGAVYRALHSSDDLMIVLHFASDKYGAAALLKRPKYRLGFKNKRITDFIWTHSHRKDFAEYMGLGNMKVLAAFKQFDPERSAHDCVVAIGAQCGANPPEPAEVVLMPGGGAGEYKRWPVEAFVQLADLLKPSLRSGASFCFVLGPDEAKEYEWLLSLERDDFKFLMTRPLPEIASAVLQARLVVANDCGPSHLAQFSGVPYVGVFHELNREWFWTREHSADVLPSDGSTEIKHVKPEDVLSACLKVLQ